MITCMSGGSTGEWGRPRDWVARVVGVRTTSDGAGSAWGVVAGMGGTPGRALAELRRETESLLAQEAGAVREVNAEADTKAEAERAAGYASWRKANPPTAEDLRAEGARYRPTLRPGVVGGGSRRSGGLRWSMCAWCPP